MKKTLYKSGFTLIELLVVIAIIGILTGIVMSNFTSAKSKARDAKRISDISQIQLALEQAFDKCNAYPANITNKDDIIVIDSIGTVCKSSDNTITYSLGYFISNPPTDFGTPYLYYVSSGSAPYTDYVLKASLENYNTALIDDVDGTPSGISMNGDTCGVSGNPEASVGNPARYYYCIQPK